MKVIAVGGKAFFHKDVLKTLGFKWYRDGKLWVVADSSYPNGSSEAFSLDAKLSGMNGVTWDIRDLPVDQLFKPRRLASAELADADTLTAPHLPEAAMPAISSIERARAALRTQVQPTVQAAPEAEQDSIPELTVIKAKIAAMRLALDEIEEMARQMSGRVEL